MARLESYDMDGLEEGVGSPEKPPRPRYAQSRSHAWLPSHVVLTAVVLLAVLVGIFIRVWILGNQPINSDEATPGLMAHQILRGHPSAFYWGQSYGSGEPYVVAALFAIAGQSPLTLNLTPAILAVAAALVVWRIGLRLFGAPAAVAAATLSWVWGEATVWNSVREIGFRGVTLLCGLVVILLAIRLHASIAEGRRATLHWLALGLFAGLGWWASPEISYFIVPAALLLVIDLRRQPTREILSAVGFSLGAFVVGALPWIVATASGAGTFDQQPSPTGYLGRLQLLFTHAAPIALGVRVEGAGAWLWSAPFGVMVLIALAAATVASAALLISNVAARVLIYFVCAFPFIYAAFSATFFWNDARYVVYLTPILALLWMGALWKTAGRHAEWFAAGVLIVALVATLIAFNDGYGTFNSVSALTRWNANPNDAVTALGDRLESDGVRAVLAQYWLANTLTFVSDGKVVALDPDSTRNPPGELNQLGAAERTWVFVNPEDTGASAAALGAPGALSPAGTTLPQLQSWAQAHDVSLKTSAEGPFLVAQLTRSVSVNELAAG